MDQSKTNHSDEPGEIRLVELGKTKIGEQLDNNLLAYIVQSDETMYVDEAKLDRVITHLGAEREGELVVTRKGQPFKGARGFTLKCIIRPLDDLPKDRLVGLGDGRVRQGEVCSVRPAGSCLNVVNANRVFQYSFKTLSYGMSACIIASGETCDTWVAQEFVDTYTGRGCQPPPAVNRKISAYVCSMP